MIQFTKQQLDNRWDILPINLREVLCSPDRGKIIWDVCEANHLTDEKIGKIARLCGFVIIGLLHQEDLTKEIKQELGLNPEIAKIIAQEVDRKIFAPIKSEIDKAYAMSQTDAEETQIDAEEFIVEEPVVTDIRRETGGVKITREVKYAQPAEVEPMRIVASGGEEKLVIPGAEEPESLNPPAGGSEFQGLKEEKPAMPEGPVVLHKEEEITPILGETKKKSLGELFGFLNGKEKAAEKETPSVAGEIQVDKSNSDVSVGAPTPFGRRGETNGTDETNGIDRVVHYDSALSTQINADKTQTNADNLTEGPRDSALSPRESAIEKESKPKLFFKNIFQAFKPTVKMVDFTEAPTDAGNETNEMNKTNGTNEINKSDGINETNMTNKTNRTDVPNKTIEEAPKIIVEEEPKEEIKETPIEEAPVEKKKGFFARLFKRKSDSEINKTNGNNETNKVNETNMTNETNEIN